MRCRDFLHMAGHVQSESCYNVRDASLNAGIVKSIRAFLGVGIGFLLAPSVVFAQDSAATVAGAAGLGTSSVLTTIGTVISVVLGLVGVIFLVLLIYSGWLWMTAGGSEEQIKKAKKTLVNGVIGIIITFSAYAIASFVLSAIGDATGINSSTNGSVTVEALSGSLGSGIVRDHYPARSATGIARNTRIMVTFKREMDVASFIDGYNSDPTATALNTSNVHIYARDSAEGEAGALTDVNVAFTEDLKTFVFDPVEYLGSATDNTWYTVSLGTSIKDADGANAFTGSHSGGYEWSFEVSTTVDLTPPTVTSIVPSADGEYDRNITVEMTFSEAIDPTSATGTRLATSGFQNIQTVGTSGSPEPGTYEISNAYRTVTFTPTSDCGGKTNSCGEVMYCLPGNESITVTASSATTTSNPPQADSFPYDGVVDASANSLDGNDDGTAGDDYAWKFTTTNDVNLDGAAIATISPDLGEEGVALDADITVTFDSIMRASTLTSDNIAMENVETSSNTSHEMWYVVTSNQLQQDGTPVTSPSQTAVQSTANIAHGVFLESVNGLTYMYGVLAEQGVRNAYQNCFVPAKGPDVVAGTCDPNDPTSDCCAVDEDTPSCCNGTPGATSCDFFTPSNE